VRPVALAKKTKKRKKKRQWQTGYSPRPPTSPYRSQSLHAGWPPVCSSILQVLLKSFQWFCRCGWSNIALPHYFGHWLIQQLVRRDLVASTRRTDGQRGQCVMRAPRRRYADISSEAETCNDLRSRSRSGSSAPNAGNA